MRCPRQDRFVPGLRRRLGYYTGFFKEVIGFQGVAGTRRRKILSGKDLAVDYSQERTYAA